MTVDNAAIIKEFEKQRNIKGTAVAVGLSEQTVRRVLIIEGLWSNDMAQAVRGLAKSGMAVEDIAIKLNRSVKTVRGYMPYEKGRYRSDSASPTALYLREYRKGVRRREKK